MQLSGNRDWLVVYGQWLIKWRWPVVILSLPTALVIYGWIRIIGRFLARESNDPLYTWRCDDHFRLILARYF